MKETGDGYFRDPRQSNRRLQDGPKLPMLCSDCEGRFSKVETPFATKIFQPLMENPKFTVCYGPFALRFLVSVLWRNVALDLDRDNAGSVRSREELELVETEWRLYLLEKTELKRYGRIHLMVTDFASGGGPQYNRYLTRDVDATSMWTDADGLQGYYAKFAKLLLFSEILPAHLVPWENTVVDPESGTIRPRDNEVRDPRFDEFLIDRARLFETYRQQGMKTISPAQRQKIRTRLAENPSRFANSELGRALRQDTEWNATILKAGSNDRCPCGSGRNFNRCHGA